jgi:hypothetical protein
MDNVLNPWPKTWAFGVDTAILQAKEEFHFLGSSPRFLLDYRWYKSIVGAAFDFNQIALTQWETFKFSTLDCRVSIPPQVGVSEIHAGSLLASRVNDLVYDMWSSNSYDEWARLAEVLTEIKLMIATIDGLEGTAQSLDDFIGKFPKVMDGDVLADLASFESWWGRGQQYLSFIRKKDYRPDWTEGLGS